MRLRLLFGALGAAALVIGLARAQERPGDRIRQLEASLVPVGQPAPRFELPAVGGSRVSLAEVNRSKPVLLNFWFYG